MTAPRDAKGVGISQDDRTDMHVLCLQNRATRGLALGASSCSHGLQRVMERREERHCPPFVQIFRRAGSLLICDKGLFLGTWA